MNLKSRKVMGFLVTDALILIVTICIALLSPDALSGEYTLAFIIGGFIVNLFIYVFGNVISKFAPRVIERVLEEKNE